ncbi:MAG: caspase family protein, partial [Desulfobacterales bacterium]
MKRFIQTIIAALIITFGVCHGQTKGIGVVSIKDSSGRQIGLYKGSYALVFGVSDYTAGWPKLPSVVEETKLVQIALENAGFIVRRVLNPNEEILKREFEQFIDRYGYERDNRLLVFFSGHGYSRRKGAKGY